MIFKMFSRKDKARAHDKAQDEEQVEFEMLSETAVFANAAESAKDNDKLEIPVFLRRETEYKTEEYLARLEQFKRDLREKTQA